MLGPMAVTAGGTPVSAPAKQRAVLAGLLLRANRVVSMESLAEELWDADPPATARNTTQGYVNRLRQVLPAGRLITRAPGYLLEVHNGELDLDRFTRLYDRAKLAAGRGDWQDAAGQCTDALALWRGEPLADVPAVVLRRTEVPRLRELRMQAIESRIEAELHLGRHGALIADLRQLTIDQPLREALHAQLMLALYRCGRQAEALEVFRAVDWRLRDELGISPGPELGQLHQRILAADPALTGGPVPVAGIRPASSVTASPAGPAAPAAGVTAAAAEARPSGGTSVMAAAGAMASPLPAPRQLPVVTPYFVGRKAEQETLTALLGAGGASAPIAVISGPPGIGKTALALHWAYQAADEFPDGQLYVNLRGFDDSGKPVTAQAAVQGFLDALQGPAGRIPADLTAQAALYRTLLAGRRVLVVLDNARDAAQVRPLLPGTAGCLTVVTSRSRLPGLIAAQGARPVSLRPLSYGEAADLLGRSIGAVRVAGDEQAARELIRWCARLPLAVSVAAARAAIRPGVPLAALAAELRDAKTRLDLLDTRDAASSVRTVYSWSCEQLSPPAARMFRLLGLHPGPDISLPAAASIAALSLPRARAVLDELVLSSLLTEDRPGRYSFHDLLHLYAAEQAAIHDGAQGCYSTVRRLLDHYLTSAHRAARLLSPRREPLELPAAEPDITPAPMTNHDEAVTWWRAECSALMGAMVLADAYQFDVHAWQLCWCLAGFFSGQGRPHEWRSAARLALSAAGRANDGYGQARARHSLGEACTTMGRYDDARPHYAAALGMYEELGDHLGQAHVHLELGLSFEFRERNHDVFGAPSSRPRQEHQANARDALTHARRALYWFRVAGDRAGEAEAHSAVGRSLALSGRAAQAVGHCERGVQMNHGGGDEAEAVALVSLGYALHKEGRYADAVSACQRAADLGRKSRILRVEAIALTHLAESHRSTGNIPAARTAWEQALVILDDLRLPDAHQVRGRLASYAAR